MKTATPQAFVAALQAGNSLQALEIACAMLREQVPLGRQWQAIGRFAAGEGEWPIAIAAMRRFIDDQPLATDSHLALTEVLSMAGRPAEVVRHIEAQALRLPPTAALDHALGVALIEVGERDRGIDRLNDALRKRPTSGATWLALTGSQRLSHQDPQFAQLATLYEGAGRLSPADQAGVSYAFGKVLADLGEHDRAFAAYAAGARIIARERPYDHARDRQSALANMSRLPLASLKLDQPVAAVMVTGKPRSGTTLIEQLLLAHPAVEHGGEINIAGPAMRIAERCHDHRQSMFRERYRHLLQVRFGDARMAVDKSLNTSRYAFIVRSALPDVPLIWVRRDPIDTAWSSFRTFFAQGLGWSFDLEAMGRFHALEDKLHSFWVKEYGSALITIDYSDLIERPTETIGRLLAHCSLYEDERVRDFHHMPRIVQTASVAQVRKPINRDGLGVAGPYRRHLVPYERAYTKARSSLDLPST